MITGNLKKNNGEYISYEKFYGNKEHNFGLLFLHGLRSSKKSSKAQALKNFAQEYDIDYTGFDLSGHGLSSGDFIDGTISLWLEDVLYVLDKLTNNKKQIIIGSSMGAWLMFLAASRNPDKIMGLFGISSAIDFTEELIWKKLTKEDKNKLEKKGIIEIRHKDEQCGYPISKNLIKDGKKHLILNKPPMIHPYPIILIHGTEDDLVDVNYAAKLNELFKSKQTYLKIIKGGSHNMNEPDNIKFILGNLKKLINLKIY